MGILLCLYEGIFLMVLGIFWTWRLVRWTTCVVGMSVPVPAVGDSLYRHDESAMTSAGEPSVLLVSLDEMLPLVSPVLHSLSLGKGMDRLLQIITCCLPCSQLRAASLYVIGSLRGSEYEAVLVWLSGESGLSTSNSSCGVLGVVGAEKVSASIRVSLLAQMLGKGTKVDRWRRRFSSLGNTVVALLTPGGHGIHEGNLPKWQESGGLESTDGLARQGFLLAGLGISDFGSDGLVLAGGKWGCADGPGKHCCLWAIGDGLGKHCSLWESAVCWGGGKL